MGDSAKITIKYALNIENNKLDILFYTGLDEELEHYEYGNSLKTNNFNQSIFAAIDEALKIYCETEGKQNIKFEFYEITITFGKIDIDPGITLFLIPSLISKFNIIKIVNIIIKNSPFINYQFNLSIANFLLDIKTDDSIDFNVCTFKGIVKSLGVILSNTYRSIVALDADAADEYTKILTLNFKELIFKKDANALRIDYKKSLFSNKKILSILTDEINYNISKYTLSKITRGYMNFYYHNSTKKLFLQYHESRGMTISCIYYNKNNVQEIKNECPKIVKITNDSKIQDNTSGGIINPSINYTTSKFGEQIINFTDRNVILSVSFMNSYFYGANCEIKEDGNKLIYTCNVCDYTKINNKSEDDAIYKYYFVDVYSKKQQIKKSDYLYLGEWNLVEDEYMADIIINKNHNNKMTIFCDGTFTCGGNINIKKEFDNIYYNNYNNENITTDVKAMYDNYDNGGATTYNNFAPTVVPEVSKDNNKYICFSVVGISYDNDNDKVIFINDYVEVDAATVAISVFFEAEEAETKKEDVVTDADGVNSDHTTADKEDVVTDGVNSDHTAAAKEAAKEAAFKISTAMDVVAKDVSSNVHVTVNGLSEYNNKIVGFSDASDVSNTVQQKIQNSSNSFKQGEILTSDEIVKASFKYGIADYKSIGVKELNGDIIYSLKIPMGVDASIITTHKENMNDNEYDIVVAASKTSRLHFTGASSLITNENPIQNLIFAGTKIEEDVKTTTYGTLNVYLNTIEPSKIKLIEKEETEDNKYKSPITFENVRITTPEDQCLEIVLPNTVIEKPEIKQIELFDGKIKFSGSTVSQLSVNSIVLYKDVNPSDVIFGINLKNIKIIKVDNTKKQKLIKRYQKLLLMLAFVNKNTDEYNLILLEILKLKKEIANTV